MLTTIVNRGAYALVPVLTIPVGMEYLGAEGFGAWVTALSTAGMITFADLGIGTGLMTRLGAGAEAGSLSSQSRRQVSSAYAAVTVTAVVCLGMLLLSGVLLDWGSLMQAGADDGTVEQIVLVTLSAFTFNIVASLIIRVQYGVGQQVRANLWQAAGNIAMLGSIFFVAANFDSPSLFVGLAAYTPVLLASVNTIQFFGFTPIGRSIAPDIRQVSTEEVWSLLSIGSKFLTISVLMVIALAADPWIVARTTDLASVPDYAIPYRVFALIGGISVMLALPLWPLHARAVASGETRWIRNVTHRMTYACGGLALLGSCTALILGPSAIEQWLPDAEKVQFQFLLWSGLACWWLAQTMASPAFMVQNGAEVLRPQTIGYALAILVIPIKWAVSSNFGYAWLPWLSFLTYCCIIWPCCLLGYRHSLRLASNNSKSAHYRAS